MIRSRTKRTPRQRAVDRLDTLFSEYIRKRAMSRVHGCERCGGWKSDWKQLQCAHLQSRKKHSVRWNDLNAVGLCGGCHRFIDSNAEAKVEFSKNILGDDYQKLLIEAEMPSHHSITDYNLTAIYLKQKIKELEGK